MPDTAEKKEAKVPANLQDRGPVELAYKEAARPGSSGSGVEQDADHVAADGSVNRFNVDREGEAVGGKGGAPAKAGARKGAKSTETEAGEEIDATDAARDLAEENEVDLNDVKGTGVDGRITVDDVREYLKD